MEFFVHVDIREDSIEEIDEDEVRYVDYDEEFEDGIALLEDGSLLLFESQERLNHFHFLNYKHRISQSILNVDKA